MAAATVSATPPGLRGAAPGGDGEASTSGSGAVPALPRARSLRAAPPARPPAAACGLSELTVCMTGPRHGQTGGAFRGRCCRARAARRRRALLRDTGVTADLSCLAPARRLAAAAGATQVTGAGDSYAPSTHRARRGVVWPRRRRGRAGARQRPARGPGAAAARRGGGRACRRAARHLGGRPPRPAAGWAAREAPRLHRLLAVRAPAAAGAR
jgi:hypothetical protein